MRKCIGIIIAVMVSSFTLFACQKPMEETTAAVEESVEQKESDETAQESTVSQETDTETVSTDITIADLWAMLGMNDADTADLFGGGEENWIEDKSFYIGRIFEVELLGETYPMYTSCDAEKMVNAVSVWLANGEREVTEEEAEQWAARLTEETGVEAAYSDTESEAGSKNWKWFFDGKSITLNWLGDILSINMNLAVGELK